MSSVKMLKALSKLWFILFLGAGMPKAVLALDLSYSGRIVDEKGAPLPGPLDLTIRFFGSAAGDDQLGKELFVSQVTLVDGVFQIPLILDVEAQDAVFGDGTRQVFVEFEALGKVYPRQSLAPVPLALRIPIDTQQFEFAGVQSKLTLRSIEIEQVLGLREALDQAALPLTIADNKLTTITSAGKVAGGAITAGTISGTTAFAGSGGVHTTGPILSSGHVILNGTGSASTELRFADPDGSNYLGFKAPATITTNFVWTLPETDGSPGSILKTDGNGNLAWITAGGGGDLLAANNLSDLQNKTTARANLGLGSIATLMAIDSLAIANGTLVDEDIASSANIATSKLSGSLLSVMGHNLGPLASKASVESSEISDLTILNADISPNAAIATTKLSGALLDVANHGLGALAALSEVGSMQIAEQTIVNADISGDAAIDATKIADGTVSSTEFQYLGNITSDVQTQLDAKANTANPNFTGAISVAPGSATAPSYTFTGDTNTGLWSSAADTLSLGTAGSERVTISSDGNVGIGTTAPNYPLHIYRTNAVGWPFFVLQGTSPSSEVSFGTVINNGEVTLLGGYGSGKGNYGILGPSQGYLFTSSSALSIVASNSNGILKFGTGSGGGIERMRITSNGSVGIGTTSPASKLSVNGSASFGSYSATSAPANGLIVSGNVGIGTTAPGAILHTSSANSGGDAVVFHGSNAGSSVDSSTTASMVMSVGGNVMSTMRAIAEGPTGQGGNGAFALLTRTSNSVTEKMRITSVGNVGIGTTAPTSKLEVSGDISTAGGGGILWKIYSGTTASADTTSFNHGLDWTKIISMSCNVLHSGDSRRYMMGYYHQGNSRAISFTSTSVYLDHGTGDTNWQSQPYRCIATYVP